MVDQVAPQEILCQLPGLSVPVTTQSSSVTAKWWEVTAHQADLDRPYKESAKSVPGRWDPRVRAGPFVSFLLLSAFVCTHFLLSCLPPLPSASLTLSPHPYPHPLTFSLADTLSTELEDNSAIFIDEWLFWDNIGNLDTFWTWENSGGKNGLTGDSFPSSAIHTKACFCYPFRKRAASMQGLTLKTGYI